MTEKEIISHFQIRIIDFDGDDRNMIHHLVKDAIESLDDPTEFDYLKFMSYYNLKTMTNEVMVKEEYLALVN